MKEYRLLRERYFISTIVIAIILILFFTLPSLYVIIFYSHRFGDESIGGIIGYVLSIVVPIIYLVYTIYVDKLRKKFLKNGMKYDGIILGGDSTTGRGATFHLHVKFKKENEFIIIRTKAYSDNPGNMLVSDKCVVYEINNKYYVDGYQVKTNKNQKYMLFDMKRKFEK